MIVRREIIWVDKGEHFLWKDTGELLTEKELEFFNKNLTEILLDN